MQLFYNKDLSPQDKEIRFSKEESKHIVKVLRKSIGDTLQITNGKGWLFSSEITTGEQKKCIAKITALQQQAKRNFELHIAVAPTKMNERYEWFLEKATEIGVDSITPIICDNSERKVINHSRYEKIVQSAMKQSLNAYLPRLNDAVSFKEYISKQFDAECYIAHCENTAKVSLKEFVKPNKNIVILIGPEGDFSSKEIALAVEHHFKPVTLGKTRLRTETAAIVACHSIVFLNE